MAANYITRQDVKARKGMSESQTTDDAIIDALIEAVSRKVDDYCNVMPGAFVGETQTRYYTADDPTCLHVDNLLDIASATGLLTDNAYNRNYSATWAPTMYDLYPYNATLDGVPYWELRVVVSSTMVFPAGLARGVKITGTFGYSRAVPPQIREACLLLIDRFLARRGNPFGVIGSGEVGTFRLSPIDPDVKEWLDRFRERVAG